MKSPYMNAYTVKISKTDEKQLSWDLYYLKMLDLVKTRSPDANTKVACILTENNKIISTGFNGWPSGIDNLPNSRPDKYLWMIHSELNSICNLSIIPKNPTAYITHYPCNVCIKCLWQINCRKIVVPKGSKFASYSEDDKKVLNLLISHGLNFVEIDKYKHIEGDFE